MYRATFLLPVLVTFFAGCAKTLPTNQAQPQTNIICNRDHMGVFGDAFLSFKRKEAVSDIETTCRSKGKTSGLNHIKMTYPLGDSEVATVWVTLVTQGDPGDDSTNVQWNVDDCTNGFTSAMDNCDTTSQQSKFGGNTTIGGITYSISAPLDQSDAGQTEGTDGLCYGAYLEC